MADGQMDQECRLRFLHGLLYGASLSLGGQDKDEILTIVSKLAAVWQITLNDLEATMSEILHQIEQAHQLYHYHGRLN